MQFRYVELTEYLSLSAIFLSTFSLLHFLSPFLSLPLLFFPRGVALWIHARLCHSAKEAAVAQRYAEGRLRVAVGAETSRGARQRHRLTHVLLSVIPHKLPTRDTHTHTAVHTPCHQRLYHSADMDKQSIRTHTQSYSIHSSVVMYPIWSCEVSHSSLFSIQTCIAP